MEVVLFEDGLVPQLFPITIGRPAFQIHCGSYCLGELLGRLGSLRAALVRPYLSDLVQADHPDWTVWPSPQGLASSDKKCLLVNARLVPGVTVVRQLAELVKSEQPMLIQSGDCVAAAVVPSVDPLKGEQLTGNQLAEWLDELQLPVVESDLPLLHYPHDVVRYHLAVLNDNLEDRLAKGDYRELTDGVFAAEGATLGDYCVADASQGPIVLEERAQIGPYCYLSGPAHLGAGARVIEHAAIKDAVALGHTTKIGGEIEASIIEPYTNKQHHGFLGHSYLGSWVNLGAGTSNSDLKNTYGQVGMEYEGRKVATGMQFIGCMIGDYAKTAVNTSIFTGKTIGVCSMVYGFVTTNVPSFTNYARSFGQVTEVSAEVLVSTQARMFARRNVVQRPCDIQLLRDMYELTRHERRIAEEPLSL